MGGERLDKIRVDFAALEENIGVRNQLEIAANKSGGVVICERRCASHTREATSVTVLCSGTMHRSR